MCRTCEIQALKGLVELKYFRNQIAGIIAKIAVRQVEIEKLTVTAGKKRDEKSKAVRANEAQREV